MLKIKHQKHDPFVAPLGITTLFKISCLGHNHSIVVNQKEFDFTRKELKRDSKTLAKAFLALGVKPSDIITIFTGRSMYDNIVIFFAANRIGAIASFLDEKTPRETIIHYLEEFNSPLLVTYKKNASQLKDFKSDAKSLKHIINLTSDLNDKNWENTILETFMVGKSSVLKFAADFKGHLPLNLFAANKEALISFTSGSTSGPKPMAFTNKNIVASAIYSKVASNVKMWDKKLHSWMSYVKFDCPYGLVVSVLAPILGGGKVILTPDITEETTDYYIGKNPDTIFGIPPLLESLPRLLSEDTDISGLKMFASGGERLEEQVSRDALEFFKSRGAKVKISNGYGVGEALGLISTAVGRVSYNPDSVGRIPAGVHVMILDPETGEELDFGKTGILYVTGKHILNRYYNRPELDDDKIIKVRGRRYVKTGDLAIVSATGYITLVGRATFFINNLPAKIYYEVVRAAVSKSELIEKCYVVKQPDSKLGLSACAYVVLKDGIPRNSDTRRAIIQTSSEPFYLGKRRITLKDYEVPHRIVFLDELPLTRANKIDFRKLEHMAKEAKMPKEEKAEK